MTRPRLPAVAAVQLTRAGTYEASNAGRPARIDAYRYLRTLLVELPKASTVDDYEALLPWRLATE